MRSNFWEWYEKFLLQTVDQVPRILSTSKRAYISNFPSKILAAKDIAKGPQLYPSVYFWTGKKLTMNSFTQFLYNTWTHFLFTRLRDIFKLSQIWILPLLQKVSSQCPEPSWSSWICSFFIAWLVVVICS